MKRAVFAILLCLVCASPALARPNLSGDWTLLTHSFVTGEDVEFDAVVEQDGAQITLSFFTSTSTCGVIFLTGTLEGGKLTLTGSFPCAGGDQSLYFDGWVRDRRFMAGGFYWSTSDRTDYGSSKVRKRE